MSPARSWSRSTVLIVLALAALLSRGLYAPAPVLGHMSWRQADTASMARSFHREGQAITSPRIDWRGSGSGEVECEFPAFPYLVGSLHGVLGEDARWGRALSIVLSTLSVLVLFALLQLQLSERSAFFGALFYAISPLNAYYGAAVQPESLMLLASLIGVLQFARWSRGGSHRLLLTSALGIALAIAIKPPQLYLGMPLCYLAYRRHGLGFLRQPLLWGYAALTLLLPAAWYWHAHSMYVRTGLSFGIWAIGVDKWGNVDLLSSSDFYSRIFINRIPGALLAYGGCLPLLVGAWVTRRRPEVALFWWWLLGVLVFLLVAANGVYWHDYYQLPMLPPLCAFVGAGFATLFGSSRAWARGAGWVSALALLAMVVITHRGLLASIEEERPMIPAVARIRELVPEDELIVAVSATSDPTFLHHLDRHGWLLDRRRPTLLPSVQATILQGARWIAVDERALSEAETAQLRASLSTLAAFESESGELSLFSVTSEQER